MMRIGMCCTAPARVVIVFLGPTTNNQCSP